MKLYYLPGACPLASNIAMEWAGQDYELKLVSREALKQPAYLALNPLGAVPTLVDGDFILTQSSAILEYIADLNPEAGLLPDTARGRAEVRRWLGLCNADIHRTFGNIFGVQGLASTPEAQQEVVEKSAARLQALFALADQQLEGQEWLAGTRSIADPYLYTVLRWAKAKNIDLSAMKNLSAFHERMEQDSGVQAALKAQGLS
ncbi:glutathione S-transferase N-terminal domain-containing protein [Pusillimonas sp. MFBS29]|uniref:glutathione S-transferase family protein n=1 Tax=Pusillimonas sp. MFBS29 TaxID=2886690 RepID=UPI001D0F8711|nr:glutathione S-transferase N-terminal domain-containing protein [Pusillimonas sp. MFBS29]MCC2595610.1 glutathione S-transferase N-terminal domain-containing protein [Pusillimonas sp. MFBS29]